MKTLNLKTLLITGVTLSPWILAAQNQSTEITTQTTETSTVTQSNPSSIPVGDGPIGKGSTSDQNVLVPRPETRPPLSFQQMDLNGDGVLDQKEFDSAYNTPATSSVPVMADPTSPAQQPTINADGSINPGAGWKTGTVTPAEYEAARAAAEAEGRTIVTPITNGTTVPSTNVNGSANPSTSPTGTAAPVMTPVEGNGSTTAPNAVNPGTINPSSESRNGEATTPQQPSSSSSDDTTPSTGTRSGS